MLIFPEKIEIYRDRRGRHASARGDRYGLFIFPAGFFFPESRELQVIVADGAVLGLAELGTPWEHVSACGRKLIHGKKNFRYYVPTWGEMCALKETFWEPEDLVVQYHPPASEHVNNHPFVLHLFRPIGVHVPAPPSVLVGIKDVGVLPGYEEARNG